MCDYENEEWRDIDGCDGYQVSDMGHVRTTDKYVANSHNKKGMRLLKGKILSESKHPSGRLKVRLINNDGKVVRAFIDELVATSFLEHKYGFDCLNHLDGDMSNSSRTNLEWSESPSRIEADGEEWRPIVGWEDYEVSDRGHVRRPSRALVNKDGKKVSYKARMLKLKTTNTGFVFVLLRDNNGLQSMHFVDRLVAEAFLPNDSEFEYVGHRNGRLDDSRVENLFWCDLDGLNRTLDKESALDSITLPGEQWADIEGYVGLYLISNTGRVYSVPRYSIINGFPHIIGGRILKPSIAPTGYKMVNLAKDCESTTCAIHRLVAKAFVENTNPDEYIQVNHLDEIKTNNNCLNLQWCTPLQNTRHGTGIQRAAAKRDYKHIGEMVGLHHDYEASAKKQSKPVLQFDMDGSFIKAWESLASVQRHTGFFGSYIGKACNRKGKGAMKDGVAYGYKWYFEEDYPCAG